MPTPLQYAAMRELLSETRDANTSTGPTGPRTPEGKARSSQNALTHGLFSTCNLVAPEDKQAHADLTASLLDTLRPANAAEQTMADEIIHATWRLRRCAAVEDANDDRATEIAVDRARSQALNHLIKSTAELRRLQTNRRIAFEVYPETTDTSDQGLATQKEIIAAIAANHRRLLHTTRLIDAANTRIEHPGPAAPPSSFCKTAPPAEITPRITPIPRSAACPCGSKNKYKRCCGRDSPPVLSKPLNKVA